MIAFQRLSICTVIAILALFLREGNATSAQDAPAMLWSEPKLLFEDLNGFSRVDYMTADASGGVHLFWSANPRSPYIDGNEFNENETMAFYHRLLQSTAGCPRCPAAQPARYAFWRRGRFPGDATHHDNGRQPAFAFACLSVASSRPAIPAPGRRLPVLTQSEWVRLIWRLMAAMCFTRSMRRTAKRRLRSSDLGTRVALGRHPAWCRRSPTTTSTLASPVWLRTHKGVSTPSGARCKPPAAIPGFACSMPGPWMVVSTGPNQLTIGRWASGRSEFGCRWGRLACSVERRRSLPGTLLPCL